MIIDTSYFLYEPLKIPHAIVQPSIGTNTPNQSEALKQAIDSMEYQILFRALGRDQVTELYQQFNEDGALKDDALQKWVDFVNGKDNWLGLRYTLGSTKKSLLAYYVYYNFLLDNQVYYTITGLQRIDASNANTVDPTSKLTRTWNQFLLMYQGDWGLCGCSFETLPDISMYSYLSLYPDLYSTQYFTIYELQNVWGI